MELKQLEGFVQVVRLNSFSRAAEALYLSQPTISGQISSLEKELGVQLLVRTTKEIYPTKLGREFYSYAENILAMRDKATDLVKRWGDTINGELNILASTVPAQYMLPELITELRHEYPQILCKIQLADSKQVVDGLTGCQWDFGMTGAKLKNSEKLIYEPVYRDKLVLILPNSINLPEKIDRDTFVKMLTDHSFVSREQGSGTLMEAKNILQQYGISLQQMERSAVFNDTQSIINGVASGLGVSIVSAIAAKTYAQCGLVRTCEIEKTDLSRSIYLVYRKEIVFSPLQECFANFVKSFYEVSEKHECPIGKNADE